MRKRLTGVLVLVVAGVMTTACDFSVHEYEISNTSARSVEVLVVTSSPKCRAQANSVWTRLDPGESSTNIGFSLGDDFRSCLLIADERRRPFFTDDHGEGGVYEVRGTSAATAVRLADTSSRYTFSAAWLLIPIAIVLGVGVIPAMFFTLSFFYRYYVSGSIRPKPPAPPLAPA